MYHCFYSWNKPFSRSCSPRLCGAETRAVLFICFHIIHILGNSNMLGFVNTFVCSWFVPILVFHLDLPPTLMHTVKYIIDQPTFAD